MIQTTLFNYFTCNDTNGVLKQPKRNSSTLLLKQTSLTHYFKTIPKKKNLVLNYFKPKEIEIEKVEKEFNIVLVDIKNTSENMDIVCVKKNMYDSDLKYITISYRWGELQEQLVETPDYTAHVTSFDTSNLIDVCCMIKEEPHLKEIPYLWIDAVSVDQKDHARKKETILIMSDIYKNASFILAIPDLHWYYLKKNPANEEVMDLIYKHKDRIHQDIGYSITNPMHNVKNSTTNSAQYKIDNSNHHHHSFIKRLKKRLIKEYEENEELKMDIKEIADAKESNELSKAYKFLAYLVDDWSNRVWVISEYQIAKEKYQQHGTPLKYIFLSLLRDDDTTVSKIFFSYKFDNQFDNNESDTDYDIRSSKGVVDSSKFIYFLKSRFTQRNYIDMIVKSNASKNEDRFYAILPSWNKYQYLTRDISNWNTTNMLSVKLKLYEILNDDDGNLWNKARLLYYCSNYAVNPILPSFATEHQNYYTIGELDNTRDYHEGTLEYLSKLEIKINENVHREEFGSIFKQNLISIQFNKQQCFLSIKADKYFTFNIQSVSSLLNQEDFSSCILSMGKIEEQLVKTPEYTVHIVDAISIDRKHHEKKKETLFRIHPIYEHAYCIITVPDLHYSYLSRQSSNNNETIHSILKLQSSVL
ncbi:unnamed protein product [Cunninghamella blakesleeana]